MNSLSIDRCLYLSPGTKFFEQEGGTDIADLGLLTPDWEVDLLSAMSHNSYSNATEPHHHREELGSFPLSTRSVGPSAWQIESQVAPAVLFPHPEHYRTVTDGPMNYWAQGPPSVKPPDVPGMMSRRGTAYSTVSNEGHSIDMPHMNYQESPGITQLPQIENSSASTFGSQLYPSSTSVSSVEYGYTSQGHPESHFNPHWKPPALELGELGHPLSAHGTSSGPYTLRSRGHGEPPYSGARRMSSRSTTRTSISSRGGSISSPNSPRKLSSSRQAADPSSCNPTVLNEYMWLSLPSMSPEFKSAILQVAREKREKNPLNDQLPDAEAVMNVLESFSQTNIINKLHILNLLYGNHTSVAGNMKLPKMSLRETGGGVEVLVRTSNGMDEPTEEITHPYLNGLRNCQVLRNHLCKSATDVLSNAEKRPHNSWFLYRGAQMNRAAILKLTETLPNELEQLQRIETALEFGVGVADREAYADELRARLVDPMDVKADLTCIGYVIAYMWALESEEVKKELTDFSRVEHDHKIKVFPNYKYAPRRVTKRNGVSILSCLLGPKGYW